MHRTLRVAKAAEAVNVGRQAEVVAEVAKEVAKERLELVVPHRWSSRCRLCMRS